MTSTDFAAPTGWNSYILYNFFCNRLHSRWRWIGGLLWAVFKSYVTNSTRPGTPGCMIFDDSGASDYTHNITTDEIIVRVLDGPVMGSRSLRFEKLCVVPTSRYHNKIHVFYFFYTKSQ